MMNNDITVELLKEKGFVEYEKSIIEHDSVDHVYQKMYGDQLGKKYFLDVKHYNLRHPYTHEDLSGYEIIGQLYLKDSHNAVNIEFLESDIDEAEKFIDSLFNKKLVEYYEKYN